MAFRKTSRKSLVSKARARHFGPAAATPARLRALKKQTTSLRSAKLAAVRQLANASTAGFLGIEKKFLDTAKAEASISAAAACTGGEFDPSTGCTGCLSCPAEGDSEQQRDGKRFVIDSLILKGYVHLAENNNAAVFDSMKVFVAVVLDTQTNGAQMNSEDCFKNLLGTASGLANLTKNLLSGNRFRILKSQVYDLMPGGAFTGGVAATGGFNATRRDFDWYIPFKGGLQVRLRDGDGNSGKNADVANVVDNSIHVIAFTTLAGAVIAYNARIRFQG